MLIAKANLQHPSLERLLQTVKKQQERVDIDPSDKVAQQEKKQQR